MYPLPNISTLHDVTSDSKGKKRKTETPNKIIIQQEKHTLLPYIDDTGDKSDKGKEEAPGSKKSVISYHSDTDEEQVADRVSYYIPKTPPGSPPTKPVTSSKTTIKALKFNWKVKNPAGAQLLKDAVEKNRGSKKAAYIHKIFDEGIRRSLWTSYHWESVKYKYENLCKKHCAEKKREKVQSD